MHNIKPLFAGMLAAVVITLSSCDVSKNIVYFTSKQATSVPESGYHLKIHRDDLLSILVITGDQESAFPFNIPTPVGSNTQGGYAQGAPTPPGYLVDQHGDIEFPMIGKIHLQGLTRDQAVDTLVSKLKPYVKYPTVIMKILNFKVTVLGEVRNPGTFTIPNERITILEALGIAGDLQITGLRTNVLVIREEGGQRKEYRLDLTKEDSFNSPAYYLKQNDVVYVEPNRSKKNSSTINPNTASLLISSVSILLSFAILLKN
ncbi:MAG: polysaccharide biosynthesis/export family protein [Flavobacteriales bacterium]